MAKGQVTKAELTYEDLLSRNPKDTEVLRLLAEIKNRNGDLEGAAVLLGRAIEIDPTVADAFHSLGEVFHSLGKSDEAYRNFRRALELEASHAPAFNSIGLLTAQDGQPHRAIAYFQDAILATPQWSVPHFNLGLTFKDTGDWYSASKSFCSAYFGTPPIALAIQELAVSISHVVTTSQPSRNRLAANDLARQRTFSIIFCSVDSRKRAQARAMYERLFSGLRYDITEITNARSLSEAYNRGIAATRGDIIILSHDDIDILASDFPARLAGHLERFDAVGVIGGISVTGPAWSWSRRPNLRGWITHKIDDGWEASFVDPRPAVGGLAVLDGVFIAGHRRVFQDIEFDDSIFDGFHLYDIDWSYRAFRAGYRIGAAGDLLISHESRGNFDDSWVRYAERFCQKHSLSDIPPPPPAQLASVNFRSINEVRAFYGHLTDVQELVCA